MYTRNMVNKIGPTEACIFWVSAVPFTWYLSISWFYLFCRGFLWLVVVGSGDPVGTLPSDFLKRKRATTRKKVLCLTSNVWPFSPLLTLPRVRSRKRTHRHPHAHTHATSAEHVHVFLVQAVPVCTALPGRRRARSCAAGRRPPRCRCAGRAGMPHS